ncbi:hypothetical protein R6Q59_005709 [Mikania micrantha]
MNEPKYAYPYPPQGGGYYQGPPVMAPPQYAAAPPPRREPGFLEGWGLEVVLLANPIFHYLNHISLSLVVTYHSMNA